MKSSTGNSFASFQPRRACWRVDRLALLPSTYKIFSFGVLGVYVGK
jgi:hypothetical protein